MEGEELAVRWSARARRRGAGQVQGAVVEGVNVEGSGAALVGGKGRRRREGSVWA